MNDFFADMHAKAEQAQADAEEAAMNAAAAFAREVDERAHRLRVEAAARLKVAREGKPVVEPPSLVTLSDFLAVEDDAASYRVERLWPTGGRVLLSASHKVGKSTLIANVLRSLVDGGKFLDQFDVDPVRSVALIDDELDERTLRRWLRQHAIDNADAVRLTSLRGRVSTFDLLDLEVRAGWVDRLRGVDVLLLDCLRPLLDALGLDEHHEAGRFLVPFDTLLRDAGIGEALVTHHMGHSAERARGDSRILDWPDAVWNEVKGGTDDDGDRGVFAADVPRYFWAYGRDVDVPQCRLGYDASTRRLSVVGGSRNEARLEATLAAIVDLLVDANESLSQRAIIDRLQPVGHKRDTIRAACQLGRRQAVLLVEAGPNNADLYFVNPSHRGSARGARQ